MRTRVEKLLDQMDVIDRREGRQVAERLTKLPPHSTPSELKFIHKALARGTNARIYRGGWPDYLLIEDGKPLAVEVKKWPDQVRPNQARMFEVLEELGIPVWVWTPASPEKLQPWRTWNRKEPGASVRRGQDAKRCPVAARGRTPAPGSSE